MKISTHKTSKGSRRKPKTLAEGTGSNVSFGWSNYESNGNENVYSAMVISEGNIHRVEFSHDELKYLVRYFNETEAGTRSRHFRSSAEIGRDPLPPTGHAPRPLCAVCSDTGWYKYDHNHSKKCDACCKHNSGGWLLTDVTAGYKPGFDTYACADGCGTIVKQLRRVGEVGRNLKIL
jgi:hypothetical protein